MPTPRQRDMAKALTALAPQMPFADAEAIRPRLKRGGMRDLAPATAVWLCTVAHIRHAYTEYDAILEDGYGRDAARFFVLDAINEVLEDWHATRFLNGKEDLSSIDNEPRETHSEDGYDEEPE